MSEDAFMPQQRHDDGSLWDELSHQQSREQIQWSQNRLAEQTASQKVAETSSAALRTAAQLSGQALSAAGSAAAAAATGARQGYHRIRSQGSAAAANRSPVSDTTGLAEFGLDSASHPVDGIVGLYDARAVGAGAVGDAGVSLLANEYEQGGGFVTQPSKDERGKQYIMETDSNAVGNGAGNNFVFLNRFRLRPREDGWGAVANLDLFFNSIYNYYYHGGLAPIIGSGIVELLSLFFTLWLSVFLFAYIDWNALASCTDEQSCNPDFHSYIIEKPFANASLWNFLVMLYCLLFLCYGTFAVIGFLASVREAFQAKHFFEERLGISARKLEGGAVEWDEIVQKITVLQESGEHRIAIHGQEINALSIAQRILRKENFLVAFFNRNMLDLTVPIPFLSLAGKAFFSKSLEWSLYFTILSYMFNHKYQIRPSFYMDPSSLRRRLILCGVAHAIFMPFLLFFMTLHFSMLNLYDWRSTKQYLGPREWSPVAKWTFREFNELPHAFERRMGPSYQASEEYLKLFTQSAAVTSLGRALVFVSGSLGAVLLAFAAVNDSILLHVKLGQWNLLWYVGILGIAFSVGKALLPDATSQRPSTRNLFSEMDVALEKVSTHTHYYPDVWQKRGWDAKTYSAFSSLFQYKAKLFAMEILSVILAPVILCISLPKCADHVCLFVQKVKTEVPGVGDVCGYSVFDFDAFEDECWSRQHDDGQTDTGPLSAEAPGDASTSPLNRKRSLEVQMRLDSRPKTRMGKMEKSFFSFKANHPSWKCNSPSGQDLVDRVETYQNQLAHALARERHAHIEAAARQLETFRQMEQMRPKGDSGPTKAGPEIVDESYISHNKAKGDTDSGADSGGGGSTQKQEGEQKIQTGHESVSMHDTVGELRSVPQHTITGLRGQNFQGNPNLQQSGLSGIRQVPSSSSLLPSSSIGPHGTSGTAASSIPHYADNGLSTELQSVLNRSTLDPGFDQSFPSLSMMNSMTQVDNGDGDALDRNAQRQYMMLERYHSTHRQQQP
mmetsp:Transcript_12819/g.27137  ORF Transcript_12819/g.27137 Transcript_12819/m.27137 type:complete len:1009 (+) Transcript_12819:43-3069(+)